MIIPDVDGERYVSGNDIEPQGEANRCPLVGETTFYGAPVTYQWAAQTSV